jgi:hypothetical protein
MDEGVDPDRARRRRHRAGQLRVPQREPQLDVGHVAGRLERQVADGQARLAPDGGRHLRRLAVVGHRAGDVLVVVDPAVTQRELHARTARVLVQRRAEPAVAQEGRLEEARRHPPEHHVLLGQKRPPGVSRGHAVVEPAGRRGGRRVGGNAGGGDGPGGELEEAAAGESGHRRTVWLSGRSRDEVPTETV